MTDPTDRAGPHAGSVMARLARPTAAEPTRVAVLADPHLSTRAEGTSKLFDHTETHVASAVADVRGRDADAVVCAGDITKDGERWNYDRFDELVADLDVPFYSVPGNHDVPKEGDEHDALPLAAFEERYTPGGLPFVARVGGVDVVGLNSSGSADHLYGSHDGEVRGETLRWLDETLPDLEHPLVVVHHNLPAMADQLTAHRDAVEPDMEVPPVMRNAGPFVDTLSAHDVPLMVTGHLHMPSAAKQDGVREIMAPTTCSFPQAYLLFDVDESGTTVRFVPVADHAGLRRGFSERATDTVTSRGLTAMAAVRLADFPLVDER